ncbi:MAG TPA: formate dehydrogenase accessory protein FdhE [Burkholderiaceae bacterium]
MSGETAARLSSPEQIAVGAGEQAPFLRLPDPSTVFAEREVRLRALAAGHAMRDYLLLIAEIALAQHRSIAGTSPSGGPDRLALDEAARRSEPPLAAERWPRDACWRGALRSMLGTLAQRLAEGSARSSVRRLAAQPDEFLEAQADRLLSGISVGVEAAFAPLIGAGLQAYWTALVAATADRHGSEAFGRTRSNTRCPCCGFRPTASIVHIGGREAGYRYLHCALCSAQWHMVRIKCAHCEGTKGIHYEALDRAGQPAAPGGRSAAAVRAECCDVCGHYLKILYKEHDHEVEPVADDLATVPLDLLVCETGKTPAGVNLMLLYGDPGDG